MDQSLKQIYSIMLSCCEWTERHEILLDSSGWIEEHSIQTIDSKHRNFEIKFVIDMINNYIEVTGITVNKPRANYPFNMGNLI